MEEDSLDEVLALGLIEHLTYSQVDLCFANTHRMLKRGGLFFFDVPDATVWCRYLVDYMDGPLPFSIEHVLSTIWGWQRWPGDEHKSGWYKRSFVDALHRANFDKFEFGVGIFLSAASKGTGWSLQKMRIFIAALKKRRPKRKR